MDQAFKDLAIKIITYIVIGVIIYLMLIRPILVKIGIIKSSEEIKAEKETKELGTSLGSPFSPTYWKQVKGAQILTKAAAEKMADKIEQEGINDWLPDDENVVYGVLRQLKYKTQLSYLADIMFQRHGYDLFQLLDRNLSEKEMAVIKGITNNLI